MAVSDTIYRKWNLEKAYNGMTSAIPGGSSRMYDTQHSSNTPFMLKLRRSNHNEVRVCLGKENTPVREMRGTDSFGSICFVLGQKGGNVAAIGFGNPHVTLPETGFRSCKLPKWKSEPWFWIICDPDTGWIALGNGHVPSSKNTLLASQMIDSCFYEFNTYTVTNWKKEVSVETNRVTVSRNCVDMLFEAQTKFCPDGTVARHCGLTCVCALPPSEPLHIIMCWMRDSLAADPVLAPHYSLLPDSSYHMTVLGIIVHKKFEKAADELEVCPELSREALSRVRSVELNQLNESMRVYTAITALRLESVGVLPSIPLTVFAMRAVCFSDGATTVELEPWDETVAVALETWRRKVSEATTNSVPAPFVRSVDKWKKTKNNKPKHYCFHMSIGYRIFPVGISDEANNAKQTLVEKGTEMCKSLGPIMCRAPNLCHFTSMAAFHPVVI